MTLKPGGTYFLTGYLDEKCAVPFIRTLIFLRSEVREQRSEHLFVDAVAWHRMTSPNEAALDSQDLLLVRDDGLETIVDVPGLIQELGDLQV
jgi:hypothetical protein